MEISDLRHFRDVLMERQQLLTGWFEAPVSNRAEETALVRELLEQIRDALRRLDDSSYGCCVVCQGEVERHHLEVQPAATVCLACISEAERLALEEDLYLASKIHRALLPSAIPSIPGFDIEVRALAAGSIGGDYYDFIETGNSAPTRIIIADAMGKGLPAGLLMSNLRGALRILAAEMESSAALLTRLNTWLCRNVPVTKFVSLVCLQLDRAQAKTSRLIYTNAGHCPPVIVRVDGTVERLNATGGVLGVHEDFTYEQQSTDLSPGDLVLLYTDGVSEAENEDGEQYEDDRLIELLRSERQRPPSDIVTTLIEDLTEFTGSPEINDDLTVILIRKN